MTKKYSSLKEETRTVSGFSEFVHNGKESIMENDEKTELIFNKTETQNFSQEKNILIQKYKGDIKKFLEKIKSYTNENICISSLKDILSLHVDLIKSSTKNIPLIIKRIDNLILNNAVFLSSSYTVEQLIEKVDYVLNENFVESMLMKSLGVDVSAEDEELIAMAKNEKKEPEANQKRTEAGNNKKTIFFW